VRLLPINPPLRPGQKVQCSRCLAMIPRTLAELPPLADADGEAFKAYYCRECVEMPECHIQRD